MTPIATVHFILLVLALLCFVAATFGMQARVNLVAAGLALWMFTLLV